MNNVNVYYFLEDIGLENFIKTLVTRIAGEEGLNARSVEHHVRNATGGKGKAMTQFHAFLRELSAGQVGSVDLLVVAIDGNCIGHNEQRKKVLNVAKNEKYVGRIACAVPDPHIERWYLMDLDALSLALGEKPKYNLPPQKCDKDYYKGLLKQAIGSVGIKPPLGGVEYADEIAANMDLYSAGKQEPSFKHFVDDVRAAIRQLQA
ncbi:MAG: DUF4276 family protein [Syntrophothermus sp.]